MSTITTINSTDVVATSRAAINTNFTNLNNDKVETLADLGLTRTASEYNNAASAFCPSGAMVAWGASTFPTGWLLCNGQAVSRSTYAALFAVISTTYGAGDGSTTFNVPNIQGRVIVGRDAGQTEFDTLGETGGAKTHTLTIPEIPSHSHLIPTQTFGTGTQSSALTDNSSTFDYSQPSNVSQTTGGGGAHNNLQPYLVLNYIIKT